MITGIVLVHLIFMAVALVLFVSGTFVARSNTNYQSKLKIHKTFIGVATAIVFLSALGLAVTSNLLTKIPHFYLGLAAVVFLILTIIGGLTTPRTANPEKRKKIRKSHKFDAAIFVILMLVTVLFGLLYIL